MERATRTETPNVSDAGHGTDAGLTRLELMVAVVLERLTAVDPEPDPKTG